MASAFSKEEADIHGHSLGDAHWVDLCRHLSECQQLQPHAVYVVIKVKKRGVFKQCGLSVCLPIFSKTPFPFFANTDTNSFLGLYLH